MIVGRTPSKEENENGKLLVGPVWEELNKWIKEIGLEQENLWVTNLCKCYPGDRILYDNEIKTCWQWLKIELEILKPSLIVALGNQSYWTLISERTGVSVNKDRTYRIYENYLGLGFGCVVVPMYHPEYVLKKGVIEEMRDRDFPILRSILNEFKLNKN
jgi:DNA polymerase